MNEIQIIQQQLATERLHFAEVANTFASSLDEATLPALSEFTHACAQYFAFAVAHLGSDSKSGAKLTAARAADATGAVAVWRTFLREFKSDIGKHFSGLDETLTLRTPMTQWRALSRIDADSIFAERALYEQVRKTLPTGITLAALGAFLP